MQHGRLEELGISFFFIPSQTQRPYLGHFRLKFLIELRSYDVCNVSEESEDEMMKEIDLKQISSE